MRFEKHYIKHTARIVAVLIITAFSCSMFFNSDNKKSIIKGVKFTTKHPIFDTSWMVKDYDSISHFFYYYEDQVACNFSYHFDSTDNLGYSLSEIRHLYFIYTKGKKYGLLIDKNQAEVEKLGNVDSVLKRYWPAVQVGPALSEQKNIVSLTNQVNDTRSGILTQEYSLKDKSDTAVKGTLLLKYTTEMMDIEYSFSKNLDSINKKKLFYYKMNVEPRYINSSNRWMAGFETMSMFEPVTIENERELLDLFDKASRLVKE